MSEAELSKQYAAIFHTWQRVLSAVRLRGEAEIREYVTHIGGALTNECILWRATQFAGGGDA